VPKQKSHRGAAKRFKATAGGKVMRRRSMHSHILTKKTTGRKRRLRGEVAVAKAARKLLLHQLLPK
jgi:large subunit ribosomal protein L35